MKKFALLLVLVLFFLGGGSVFAQEASDSADESAEQPNHEKIVELRNLYTQQIDAYRISERQYAIAKDQYHNLQTLKLLEEAVQATKQAMLDRNRVLLTYLDILFLNLEDAAGVNLTYKENALEGLENQVETLRDYQNRLEETTNREELAERVVEFEELRPAVEDISYRALSLIAIGRLQTVHDKSRLILADLEAYEGDASASAFRKSQLERAYSETERNLELINSALRKENDRYSTQEDLIRKTYYTRVLETMEPVFADLSQMLSYLKELLTI